MTAMILDRLLEERLIAERQATDCDRYDEAWEGIYMMAPMANDEHQDLVAEFTGILLEVVKRTGRGEVRPGVNVSDRAVDWKQNYRVPDVAVFLKGGRAKNLSTHWHGGPDLAIEIVSAGDRTREKLPFYEAVGTRELLIVDRQPWRLEHFRLENDKLRLAGSCDLQQDPLIESEVVPLSFRLVAGSPRPQIEVAARDSEKRWMI